MEQITNLVAASAAPHPDRATPGGGLAPALADGMRLTLAGAVIGTAIGLAIAQYLKTLLFGVSTTDATTLGVSITVVLLAGLAASVIPARRASRVEITTLMREN